MPGYVGILINGVFKHGTRYAMISEGQAGGRALTGGRQEAWLHSEEVTFAMVKPQLQNWSQS